MFPWIEFLLTTTAIVIIILCYVILLTKLKPSDEPSESFDFSEFLQENNGNLSSQRRMELLEKIKEERINEYLNSRKKRKLGDS